MSDFDFNPWTKKKRKPRILTNLDIQEISSVDRGAGVGVRALMLKRDGERKPTMLEQINKHFSEANWPTACEFVKTAAERGEMDSWTYGEFMQRAAMQAYPGEKNSGRAMARFLETDIGKSMANVGVRLPTLAQVAKARDPNDDKPTGDGQISHQTGEEGESFDRSAKCQKDIGDLMKTYGMSYDHAATIVHRAEKMDRGLT
jgi:hypothetical protein